MHLGIDAANIRSGGGVSHLVEVLRAAQPAEAGFERVTVWAPPATLQKLPQRPWLVALAPPLLTGSFAQRLAWQRYRLPLLCRAGCDVLFAPGGLCAGGFAPCVTMSRNMLPFEPTEMERYGPSWMGLRLRMLRWLQAGSFRRADGLIFLTRYAQAAVLPQVGSLHGLAAIIPHGVHERFLCPPRPQLPLSTYGPQRPFRLLYVSIVDVYKHQWQVVQAVAQLRAAGLPVSLDLVGPAYGPALRQLHQAITRYDPRGQWVRSHGEVGYGQLSSVYHAADGFVFASSCENMPNILVEAMAAGLPIACSRRGPMPEILGHAGVWFDPEQPDDIAAALTTLLEDVSGRETWAWRAYEATAHYSWERCATET
ncbi:MAG: glycosyltransferase family 4 protein, partial [Chloroflexaceae bacterium]|nr:glycosyltransferase family 4 protein [Chloroflexaceae bacterium]